MIEFTAHASSSAGNLYTVTDGRTMLGIECGVPFRRMRRALGFDVSRLAGVLVSHAHGDHACAVPGVMKAGVDVYASGGTWDELCVSESHRVNRIRADDEFGIGTWWVRPFGTVHDAAEPLGFFLASGADRVLFMVDSAYCRYRFAGLTHICVETNYSEALLLQNVKSGAVNSAQRKRVLENHMSLERLLEMLDTYAGDPDTGKPSGLRKVLEIHLLHLSDTNSDAKLFQRTVAGATGKPVFVAPKHALMEGAGGSGQEGPPALVGST